MVRLCSKCVVVLGVGLLTAACPQNTEVWVVDGSTTSQLRFQVADGRRPDRPLTTLIRVERKTSDGWEFMWGAGPGVGAKPISVFQYGIIPGGFERLIDQPAETPLLQPGCYIVFITGDGHTYFRVRLDGVIAPADDCEAAEIAS